MRTPRKRHEEGSGRPPGKIEIRCQAHQLVDLNELEPFQGNLKELTREAYWKLRTSLEEKGIRFPTFFWEHEGRKLTLDGHQRARVLRDMIADGWTLEGNLVPADRIEADTEEEAKELILLATSQYARTTEEGLYEFLVGAQMDFEDLRRRIDLPGINLDRFEAGYLTDIPDEDAPVDLPATPRTRPGDLYEIGDHRILCGDATDPAAWDRLMQGEKADLVFTDPPYNVDYQGEGEKTSRGIENDNLEERPFRDLLEAAFDLAGRHAKEDAPLYTCYASRTHREFEDALNQAGWVVRAQIIWVKMLASLGWGNYRWKHEPMFYAARRTARLPFFGDRSQYTVWEEDPTDEELLAAARKMLKADESGGSTVWRLARDKAYEHPTQKPVRLVGIALKNSSKAGNLVLDPFAGAGTTGIAAMQMGRRARLLELDPAFVDATITRLAAGAQTNILRLNGFEIPWRTTEPPRSTETPACHTQTEETHSSVQKPDSSTPKARKHSRKPTPPATPPKQEEITKSPKPARIQTGGPRQEKAARSPEGPDPGSKRGETRTESRENTTSRPGRRAAQEEEKL